MQQRIFRNESHREAYHRGEADPCCDKTVKRIENTASGIKTLAPFVLVFAFLTGLYYAAEAKHNAPKLRFEGRAPMHGKLTFGELKYSNLPDINIKHERNYSLSDSANFIASHEGFSNCAYPDLGGGYSIGYGTVSHKGECITKEVALLRLEYLVRVIQEEIIIPRLGKIPEKDMVVMTDVVFNVRPKNYEYIFKQYEISDSLLKRQELTYALSRMQYAWTPMTKQECINKSDDRGQNQIVYDEHGRCRLIYGGLRKRFLARIDLLFA